MRKKNFIHSMQNSFVFFSSQEKIAENFQGFELQHILRFHLLHNISGIGVDIGISMSACQLISPELLGRTLHNIGSMVLKLIYYNPQNKSLIHKRQVYSI